MPVTQMLGFPVAAPPIQETTMWHLNTQTLVYSGSREGLTTKTGRTARPPATRSQFQSPPPHLTYPT